LAADSSGGYGGKLGDVSLTASIDELQARIRAADSVLGATDQALTGEDRLKISRAWIEKGDAQRELRDFDAAAVSYEQTMAVATEGTADLELSGLRALARTLRAVSLAQSGRNEDAAAECAGVLELVGRGDTETLRRSRAVALTTRAQALRRLGRLSEAWESAETIVTEFADDLSSR